MAADFLTTALYVLALINPVSKVFLLTTFAKEMRPRELRAASVKASAIALAILLVLAAAGNFLLHRVFHVEIYSLQIAGGAVLFALGLKALMQGVFFEKHEGEKLADVSIAPLASPMLAGPGTITAAISLSSEHGLAWAAAAVSAAMAANLGIMLLAPVIGEPLKRHNMMGALIRITGLVVATIAVQMVLGGAGEWWRATLAAGAAQR